MEKLESKNMNKYSDTEIIDSFFVSLSEGDPDDIKASLYSILSRFGATNVSRETGIPRSTLYDMCKDDSNPTLNNLCDVIEFLKSKNKSA